MGAELKTGFFLDQSKCVRCGRCVNTCSGMVIEPGKDGYPRMKPFERYGWRGRRLRRRWAGIWSASS